MKPLARRIATSLAMLLLQCCAAAPVFLLAALAAAPARLLPALALPALACAAQWAAALLPPRARRLLLPLLAVLSGASAYLLLRETGGPGALYAALCLLLGAYLSFAIVRGPSLAFLAGALPAHCLCGLLTRMEALAPAAPAVFGLSCFYFILFAFYLNRSNLLESCAAHGQRPTRPMLLGNALMCGGFLLAAFALSQFDALRRAATSALRAAGRLLARLWALLAPKGEVIAGEGGFSGFGPLGEAAGEIAPIWAILERIAWGLLIVAAAVLLVLLFKRLPRLLRALRGRVRALLARYFGALSADYEDQAESLGGWGEWRREIAQKARFAPRPEASASWARLNNRQRVRAAYARLRTRADLPPSATAREAIEGGALPLGRADGGLLADSYDRARYSEHPISDQEAENARRALRP